MWRLGEACGLAQEGSIWLGCWWVLGSLGLLHALTKEVGAESSMLME